MQRKLILVCMLLVLLNMQNKIHGNVQILKPRLGLCLGKFIKFSSGTLKRILKKLSIAVTLAHVIKIQAELDSKKQWLEQALKTIEQ